MDWLIRRSFRLVGTNTRSSLYSQANNAEVGHPRRLQAPSELIHTYTVIFNDHFRADLLINHNRFSIEQLRQA